MKRKMLLVLVLVMCLISITSLSSINPYLIYAEPSDSPIPEDITAENVVTGNGSGESIEDPYLISTKTDLIKLAENINNGIITTVQYYKVIENIDMENEVWTPIGITDDAAFNGYFDFNSKVISNYAVNADINIETTDANIKNVSSEYGGLFGLISNDATVIGYVTHPAIDIVNGSAEDNLDIQSVNSTIDSVANSDKAISSFNFEELNPVVKGNIDENAKTINLIVPNDTDLKSLIPTITYNGASISPDSGAAQDFTLSVTYTVTAEDGSTQDYIVTVENPQMAISPNFGVSSFGAFALAAGAESPPVAGFGKTIEFDGASYVEIPNNSSHNIANNFTIEFWFKSASITQGGKYLISRNSLSSGQWAVIYEYTDNKVEFYATNCGTANPRTGSAIPLNDTKWHHIAYTYDGSNWCGYMDGKQEFSVTRSFNLSSAGSTLYIGGTIDTVHDPDRKTLAQGCIDEVRIWKKGLSAETIADWMYREVDSTHPDYTTLSNYYKLNEGTGTVIADAQGTINGTFINGQNSQWQASDIRSWTTDEDTPLTGKLVGSDPDGSNINGTWNLTFEIVSNGSKGTAEIIADNEFTYTPYMNQYGSDTFMYRVKDSSGNYSDEQSVNITINPVADSDKIISSFNFAGLEPAAIGDINEAAKTINLIVPYGTDLKALVPTITYSGVSISPDSGVAQDFTSPVSYTVTAEDNTIQNYIVTVNNPPISITTSGGNTLFMGEAVVVDPDLTIISDTLDGARVMIENMKPGDVLGYTGDLPSGVIGFWSGTTGILSFTGSISAEQYQALLRTVIFNTTSDSTEFRTITFSLGSAVPSDSGHYYEFVKESVNWTTAKTNAGNRRYFGMQGYLATITSPKENELIQQRLQADAWIGASDSIAECVGFSEIGEGNWYWVTGPESGNLFSKGNINPVLQSERYMNWNNGEPNNCSPGEHYGEIYSSGINPGRWNDLPNSSLLGYIVEYGGMSGDPNIQVYASKVVDDNRAYNVTFRNWDEREIKTEIVEHGSAAIAPANPTREGYTFIGWNTPFNYVTSNLTITATYTINSYNLNYDANGATAGIAPANTSHVYNSTVTVEANSGNLLKRGYTFAGWNTKTDGTGVNYEAGIGTFTMAASDMTLYARWTANTDTKYTVNHYQQDVYTNTYTLKETEHKSGTTDTTATAEAKTYAGFSENTAHSNRYASGNIAGDGSLVLNLYYDRDTYIVSFNTNGGSAIDEISGVRYEAKITAPAEPTRAGYTFSGWYSDEGLTNIFSFDTAITKNVTLYSKWDVVTYNITYNLDGGTNYEGAPISYTVESETITLGTPTKTGYTFMGWYDAETEGNQVTQITKGSTGDKNLYAIWTANIDTKYTVNHYQQDIEEDSYTLKETENKTGTTDTTATAVAKTYTGFRENTAHASYVSSGNIAGDGSLVLDLYYGRNTYTVSFNTNGGSAVDEIRGVRYEANIVVPTAPKKEGYTFGGWYSDEGLTNIFSFDTAITKNVTFYAKWDVVTYNITYNLDGGRNYEGAPINYTVESNAITLGTPTKIGYTFMGWYDAETGGSQVTQIAQGSAGDKNLYAKWAIVTYSITYNLDGGNYGCVPIEYTVESPTIELGTPTKTGYTFMGWYDAETGGSKVTQIANGSTGHKTLYAIWTANTDTKYTVNHYQQDIEGDSYTLKETENKTGTTDTTATEEAKTYTGFSKNTAHASYVSSGNIAGDGSLVLNLYYDRDIYAVSFNTNGGSSVEQISGVRYEKADIPAPKDPTKAGYDFKGWYSDSKLTNAFDFTNAITKDITLYAKWNVVIYNITYNLDGGTNYEGAPISYTVESETITLGTPTKTGYTFTVWYDAQTEGSQITQITKGSIGHKALYARWAANTDTKYSVNHYQQDIEGDSYTLKETEHKSGTTDTTVTAEAKTYTGFSENETHSSRYASGNIAGDGSLVLNLYYDRNTYTVSFDTNGGSAVDEISGVRYEACVTKPEDPTRAGYTFSGWYSDSGFAARFDFTSAITGDMTLYAKWRKDQPANEVEVLVNGKAEKLGKVLITKEDENTIATVIVDEKKLEQKLEQEGSNAIVTIPASTENDVFVGQLNGQIVKNMENKQAVVEIKTEEATYILPAQQINIDAVSEKIGKRVELKDIKVQIQISKPNEEKLRLVENSSKNGEFTIVAPPVEFTVRCAYENKVVEVNSFSSYVERTIAIPEGADLNKITTGIIIDPDGTVRHVPTKIIVIDGKYYAKINSLTNSTYSVIWHPKEFEDLVSHWAKVDINDLGSRLILDGMSSNIYQPDIAITRAEFADILVRALGLKISPSYNTFTDIKDTDWYYESIGTAAEYKLLSGYGQGKFGPLDKITREQAMVMIDNAMKITALKINLQANHAEELLSAYADSGQASEWAKASIAKSLQAGIVTGKPGKTIAPKDEITRAEVAVIIRRLLKKSDLI